MKKAVMYFGESMVSPYRYNTEWPEWSQGFFRDAVMYYLTSNLKEKDPALGLLYLGELLEKFIEDNKCNKCQTKKCVTEEIECQAEESVAEAVRTFRKLKFIRHRLAHPGKSKKVVSYRHRLIPLCLQIVHAVMNNLYPARRLDDPVEELVIEVSFGRSSVSSTASDRSEKEAFYRSVYERNRDIVENFLKAIPTEEAILDLSVDELACLLESRVTVPAIIHDGDEASFEVPLGVVSKGVCEYESSPEGWMCRARNAGEDPWKDDKWACEKFAGGG